MVRHAVTRSGEIMARLLFGIICLLSLAGGLSAQRTGTTVRVRLEGDWLAKSDDGIRHIMVRPDSSAQFGDQVARWRLVRDSLWLTLGDGVWMVYGLAVGGDKLTISGGDLQKPVTLRRTGAASARPDTLAIPAAPPDTARAWD
jgi:hypothetical protein